jgi:hypothetical protein
LPERVQSQHHIRYTPDASQAQHDALIDLEIVRNIEEALACSSNFFTSPQLLSGPFLFGHALKADG